MAVSASLRALLDQAIDYAGMFPPCALALEPALRNQASYVRFIRSVDAERIRSAGRTVLMPQGNFFQSSMLIIRSASRR